MNRAGITLDAVKEAIDFIDSMWGDWEGDFQDFVANVISDQRVTSHDVRYMLDALSKGEHIDGCENLSVQKQGSKYKVKYNQP